MTVYAITDTKKGRTGTAPTYLQTTRGFNHRQQVSTVTEMFRHVVEIVIQL